MKEAQAALLEFPASGGAPGTPGAGATFQTRGEL